MGSKMHTHVHEDDKWTATYWWDDNLRIVMSAQTSKENGESFITIGSPLLPKLTQEESLAVADEFAAAAAVLLDNMRARLAAMREK